MDAESLICGPRGVSTKRRERIENLTSGSVKWTALGRSVSDGRPEKPRRVSILVAVAHLLRSWVRDCTDMPKNLIENANAGLVPQDCS